MEQFAWDDSFTVGVSILDKQHRAFIDVANKLFAQVQGKVRNADISLDKQFRLQNIELVMQLRDYSLYHFHTEETLMRLVRHSNYIRHRLAHNAFSKRMLDYETKVIGGDHHLIGPLFDFVREWYLAHVTSVDRAYISEISRLSPEQIQAALDPFK